MIRKDVCMVHRVTKEITKPYNRPVDKPETYGPYKCHVGRSTGTATQGQPQMILYKTLKLYTDASANIKDGDIIEVNGKDKYIAENTYRPLNKHTECDLTIKEES